MLVADELPRRRGRSSMEWFPASHRLLKPHVSHGHPRAVAVSLRSSVCTRDARITPGQLLIDGETAGVLNPSDEVMQAGAASYHVAEPDGGRGVCGGAPQNADGVALHRSELRALEERRSRGSKARKVFACSGRRCCSLRDSAAQLTEAASQMTRSSWKNYPPVTIRRSTSTEHELAAKTSGSGVAAPRCSPQTFGFGRPPAP